jgi:phospholipid/cholesterol/gamma-HCH transport system substrate-binding protein
VRVSGAKAGAVKEILPPTKPSEKFRVKMEVAEDLHPLVRTDSVAGIEVEGLVGGTFLSIGTGTDQAPKAAENSTIPSREAFAISDLLQQMSDTITTVNKTIDDLKGDVQRAVVSIADTAGNANALIAAVSDDVKTMASAGARISGDAAEIAESIRQGKGTIGKLVNDDELYRRAIAIAKSAEEIASNAREVVEQARQAVVKLQAKDGPVQGMATNVKQTLDDARIAMAGFAENMEALKHNFFFRGFFTRRGYFTLADLSPAEYRQGVLTHRSDRRMLRVWLEAGVLFAPSETGDERLTDSGKARLDSAIAEYLEQINSAIVMVEGYTQPGTVDEQYLRSHARAAAARDYLISKFHLDPQRTGLMPLGSKSPGSPDNRPWDGLALAVFLDKQLVPKAK